MARTPATTEIRDPVHGVITVDDSEKAVVDHPFLQRLRGIRQLGFADLPFPGATHSRYSHSLGAMHLAGRAFDACFFETPLAASPRGRAFRQCLRLAALCHDVGHAPFSHATEFAMPGFAALGLACLPTAKRQASHEDYTLGILTETSLADVIGAHFDFHALHVASLVSPDVVPPDDFFFWDGLDHRGLLSQIISSELDADRLDYLVRDSVYTGARYGQIDVHWLVSNLTHHTDGEGRVCLALDDRAIYAFDDFQIARFHMFVMVYFHAKSVAYEQMLQRYMRSDDCAYEVPTSFNDYLHLDDAQLIAHLRASDNPWARRVVERRPFRVAYETRGLGGEHRVARHEAVLQDAGLDTLVVGPTGSVIARPNKERPQIWVRNSHDDTVQPLEEATAVFARYENERKITRLYVRDDQRDEARTLLKRAAQVDKGDHQVAK